MSDNQFDVSDGSEIESEDLAAKQTTPPVEPKKEPEREDEVDLDETDLEEDDSEDDVDDPDHDEDKRERGMKKRLFKEREKKRQLRRENAELKAKLSALKSDAPNIDDFEDYDEYLAEKEKYESAAPAQPATPLEFQEAVEDLWEQAEDWDAKPQDFEEKVKSKDFPVSQELVMLIADMDNGAEMLYHLATNPEDFKRVAGKRTPELKAIALDRLSSRLSAASVSKTNIQKKGVIDPVGGSSGGRSKPFEKMSEREYIETRNKTEGDNRFW